MKLGLSLAAITFAGASFLVLSPGPAAPVAVLAAYRTSEVQTVLAEAARLSGKGCWVAGFVAYEAAPAFDAALATQAPAAGWPLAWFAAYGGARPATARTRPAAA